MDAFGNEPPVDNRALRATSSNIGYPIVDYHTNGRLRNCDPMAGRGSGDRPGRAGEHRG